MKKTVTALVTLFIFINIFTINIFAEDLGYIEETLISIGIDEEYSENIVQYLENINITESDFKKIENNIDDIKSFVEDSKNEEKISFLKYYSVYDNIIDISKMLNLDLDFDINNLNIRLVDKNNNNLLFEGDTNSLVKIYSNYKEGNYDLNIAEVFKDINSDIKEGNSEEDFDNSEDEFNNEINNALNVEVNNNIDNSSEVNSVLDEYIDKFDKYNENLLVNNNNNNDMLEVKIIVFVFGVALILLMLFKIISRFKTSEEEQFEE